METWKSVPLSQIRIPEEFLLTLPNQEHIAELCAYVQLHHQFDRPVTLDASHRLVDGYKRYVVARELQLETVPAIYVVQTPAPEENMAAGEP